jgi:hypothetical protein
MAGIDMELANVFMVVYLVATLALVIVLIVGGKHLL